MSYTQNLRILVGKLEGTPGTMETLTSADFDARVRNPEISPQIEMDDEASKYANGNHGEDEVITGAQSAQITFQVRMNWGGTATTEPEYFKFFNACGCNKVTYGSTGISLQPLKELDTKTITLWVYDIATGGASPGAICYKFAGAAGNVTIAVEGIGKPWVATFTFTGKFVDITDETTIPEAGSLDGVNYPEKFLCSDVEIFDVTEKVTGFELDADNEITPLINQADCTGYDYFHITKRSPRFSTDPLMSSVATADRLGNMTSGITGAITTGEISIAGTNLSLHIPKAQEISMGVANREGLVSWDLNYKCLGNGVTGALAVDALPPECTWELLQGARA